MGTPGPRHPAARAKDQPSPFSLRQHYAPSVFEKYTASVTVGNKEVILNLYDTAGECACAPRGRGSGHPRPRGPGSPSPLEAAGRCSPPDRGARGRGGGAGGIEDPSRGPFCMFKEGIWAR